MAVGIAWGASYAQDHNFGASFNRAWFIRGHDDFVRHPATLDNGQAEKRAVISEPLVGIEVSVEQLSQDLSALLSIKVKPGRNRSSGEATPIPQISGVIKKMIDGGQGNFLSIKQVLGDIGLTEKERLKNCDSYTPFLNDDGKTIVIIANKVHLDEEKEKIALASGEKVGHYVKNPSVNGSYVLFVDLAKILVELNKQLDGKDYEVNSTKATISSKPVSWKNRGSVSVNTNFAQQDTTLINTGNPTAKSQRTAFSVGFKSASNPLQGRFFPHEKSNYDFSISGVLTGETNDKQSRISLAYTGVTNMLSTSGLLSTRTFQFDTSQHARQQSFLYDIGWKVGDARLDGTKFVPLDKVDGDFTFNFGIQLGYIFFKSIQNVDPPDKKTKWMVRPRFTVGFNNLLHSDGSLISLSGKASLYAVSKSLGGADKFTGYAEEFELALKFGPENQQLALSVSGGRNRSQDFVKVAPTYGLGLNYKF